MTLFPPSMRSLLLALGLLALAAGADAHAQNTPAAKPQLVLNFDARPRDAVKLVSLTRNGMKLPLSDGSSTEIHIDLDPPLPEESWIVVEWKGNLPFSAYPLRLMDGMAGDRADLLIVGDAKGATGNDIHNLCVGQDIKSVTHAFEMYFSCKTAANADTSFNKPRRAALQGWLKANLYLIRMKKNSPYTYDSDLYEMLKSAVQDADRNNTASYWNPLRIDDARAYLKSYEIRQVGLFNTVRHRIAIGDLPAARETLDIVMSAYNDIVGQEGTAAVDGINRAELVKTGTYIDTLEARKASGIQ